LFVFGFYVFNLCIGYFSHGYDKIPDINNLKMEGFILVHGFGDFIVLGSVDAGPMGRQNTMVVEEEAIGQEAKRSNSEGARARSSPHGDTPSNLLSPIRPHLPLSPPLSSLFKFLIHQWIKLFIRSEPS
jgi:hypothetical protein